MLQKFKDNLFLRKQRKGLEREKKRIQSQIEALKKFPDYGTSDEAHTEAVEEYESNLSLETNLSNLSEDIDKALKRINEGTYDKCEQCKGPIEKGRLEIYPAAIICASCTGKTKKR